MNHQTQALGRSIRVRAWLRQTKRRLAARLLHSLARRVAVRLVFSLAAAFLPGAMQLAWAEEIGEVNTAFHLVKDDRITVEAYDDPLVKGVTCYVSRARTGGLSGAVGLAQDKSEASIACRQVAPISFAGPLPVQDDIFSASLSILFKRLHVVRMVDVKRQTLVYLTYSDRLIDGSPKNAVTAVAIGAEQKIPMR